MSAFSREWLALREPYDLAARNPAVLTTLAATLADRDSLAIVDLACGAGATLRAISSRLPRDSAGGSSTMISICSSARRPSERTSWRRPSTSRATSPARSRRLSIS